MASAGQLYARLFAVACLAGTALSIAKTIRVFSINHRELGSPRGAAEDWFLLVIVLLTAAVSAWTTQDIVAIGRNTIVVFSFGFAVISFLDAAEVFAGIVPRYTQVDQSIVERSWLGDSAMGAISLTIGVGISQRRFWGHVLCLIVSVLLGLGCIGYLALDGLDWKPIVSLIVISSVIIWLRLPVVRYGLKESSAQ
jgi:hypothetical protein